ncbi:hypothetical protein QR680_015082 [Steinernema hermaphroditum]|uniref:G-protein coupled receptors family 1 profile domain-containing protein n=1 Tax=Steinernema hermaphroditum TaxID=289476 RepID=A0AA39IB46_9BILA|nr:hypothetical protein QR680_015082 [Steinernema hermaphroditum]
MSPESTVNLTEEFHYGSELQGRGYMTELDTLVGLSIWVLASAAVMVGFLNLYLIKKLSMFHNSFGVLWISRTIGDIGANLPNVFYTGPVTIFQPKDIHPAVGIVAWTIAFFFSFGSCIMVQSVSVNRMIAVCSPLNYEFIFTKRVISTLIIVTWIAAALIISMYYIVPCSLLGYSPQYHEHLFIKCRPDIDRDYSLFATIGNRGCFSMCSCALVMDTVTLIKIIQIKVRNKAAAKQSAFRRNVRFFAQAAFQNITMMGTLVFQVLANNSKESGRHEYFVLAYDTLILTQLNNGLALILFNPEVRTFLGLNCCCLKKSTAAVIPCSTLGTSSTLTTAANNDN